MVIRDGASFRAGIYFGAGIAIACYTLALIAVAVFIGRG